MVLTIRYKLSHSAISLNAGSCVPRAFEVSATILSSIAELFVWKASVAVLSRKTWYSTSFHANMEFCAPSLVISGSKLTSGKTFELELICSVNEPHHKLDSGWSRLEKLTTTWIYRFHSVAGDGGYAPQCDDSTGKFSKEQGWGSTGSSWCADPTTGHQISQSQGSGRGSATLNC